MDSKRIGGAMRSRKGTDVAVDIVISNYNYAAYLADAIDSARQQTHSSVSVIVVDDGSTDDSRDLLRSYGDQIDIVLKDNGGQASALNAGMARCRGDVVIFLDADDRLRPHTAARAAEAFATSPRLSKLQFPMAVIDSIGRTTGATKPHQHRRAPIGDLRRAELAFPFDLPWLPGGGTAFRADSLRRIFPIPVEDYPRLGADWYLVHLTALLGEAALLDEVCAEYRVHGRNGYEPQDTRLDLRRVRDSIAYAESTASELARLADELGLERPNPILSVSSLANRLISLRLEPELHPLPADHAGQLVANAARAARRRFDVSWPMRLALIGWCLAVAISPRFVARRLSELLVFPERRYAPVNSLLRHLRRKNADRALVGEA